MSLKAKGGITKGKSHAEGGMPMVVKSTGQKVELEGGEGVINKKNMADTQKHEFEGKMLTKCEIASEINSDGGNGVDIDCDGIVGKKYKHQDGGRLGDGGDVDVFPNDEIPKYELYSKVFRGGVAIPKDTEYGRAYDFNMLFEDDLDNDYIVSQIHQDELDNYLETNNLKIIRGYFRYDDDERNGFFVVDKNTNEILEYDLWEAKDLIDDFKEKYKNEIKSFNEMLDSDNEEYWSKVDATNERFSNFAKGGTIYNEELINGYEWDVSNQDHKKLPNRAIRFNKKNNRYELYNYTNNETDYSYSDLDDLVRNVNNIMGETFSTNYEAKKDGSQLYDELEYGKMAKGGEIIFTDVFDTKPRSYKTWETRKSKNTNQNSFGAFAHRYNDRYKGDYYLYRLSQYDEDFYSHIPLKDGEILARVETDNMIGGEMPLVKININNGRVYFMSDENNPNSDDDNKNPKFNRASADVIYLSLDESTKDYQKFGYDKHSRYKNIRYETDLSSYDIDSLVRRMDNYYDINYEELFGLNKQAVIDFITSYNMGRGMASFELHEFFQIESALNEQFFQSLLKEYKKKQFGDGGRLGDIKFDVEEVARQFDAIDSDGTKYEGEVINPLSKSEKNQIIKAIKNIVEKVDGRFSDIVVDDFTNEEIYINLIFDNDVYDNSPQDIILYRKTFELNNSDESYIDHRYLYESGYKYAKGGSTYGEGGKLKNGDVVEVKPPNYGYDSTYYVVSDKAGYNEDGFLISQTSKRLSDVFEEEQLEKLYAKGGSIRRINNSPMLRYVNFEDGWHLNLLKLKPSMNQNGKPYKGKAKYGISRQGGEQGQEVWEFETLNEADTKFNELVELGKTYSNVETQGDAKDNYANGGNLDGFDETWNKFKENTREAFGQPRNRKVVSLESDFGYRKSELPQLRTKDKPMFVKSLISKYGANVVSEGFKVKASQLKPIQNEINLEQVEVISNVSKGKMNPNKPITISQDGYVIDGHHRWYYAKENDLKLSVLQINLNAMQVIDEIWQSGLAKKEDISSVRMKQGGQLN